MPSFKKILQKFFLYSFTGISVGIVVLGINRAKQSDALAVSPTSDQASNKNTPSKLASKNLVLGQSITAKGAIYETPWGATSASITLKEGKVTAVTMPEVPDSPPSTYAKPFLIAQALRAGNANIQGVSGATITSNAFKASLNSAIASARTQEGALISKATLERDLSLAVTPKTAQPPASSVLTVAQKKLAVSGQFTGNTYKTPWGNAVASIVVTKGKITEVTMPQVPNSPPSTYAEPYLVDQALRAGSAKIQGVSGATYTSLAFKSSLESAIAKASAQGTVTASPVNTTTKSTSPSYPRRYRDDNEWDD
jgi:uncharacterized protein with FMN-binding domain